MREKGRKESKDRERRREEKQRDRKCTDVIYSFTKWIVRGGGEHYILKTPS